MDNAKNTITINEVMPDAEGGEWRSVYDGLFIKEPGNNTRLFFYVWLLQRFTSGNGA